MKIFHIAIIKLVGSHSVAALSSWGIQPGGGGIDPAYLMRGQRKWEQRATSAVEIKTPI